MINFIDNLLRKMGPAFGIIFKIIIPAVLFFYPFKMLVYGFSLFSIDLGFDASPVMQHSQIISFVLFMIFVLLLIFCPRVASVIEFIVTPLYFISLYYFYNMLFQINFFSLSFSGSAPYLVINKICAVLIVVFIIFKILFFFFIMLNQKNLNKPENAYAEEYFNLF